MNASAQRNVVIPPFTGAEIGVIVPLPFRFQIDCEQKHMEPLAPEFYAPLGKLAAKQMMRLLSRLTADAREMELEAMLGDGLTIRGGIRNLSRGLIGGGPVFWQMDGDTVLVFDNRPHRPIRLTKFAEDHFAGFLDYDEEYLFVVRLRDNVSDF